MYHNLNWGWLYGLQGPSACHAWKLRLEKACIFNCRSAIKMAFKILKYFKIWLFIFIFSLKFLWPFLYRSLNKHRFKGPQNIGRFSAVQLGNLVWSLQSPAGLFSSARLSPVIPTLEDSLIAWAMLQLVNHRNSLNNFAGVT